MKKNLLIFGISCLSFFACKDKEAEPAEENELITTLQLNFKNGITTETFVWKDLDGEGGMAPQVQNVVLKPNTTYDLSVKVLDESKNPVLDITQEVKEKDDEHLFLYIPQPSSLLAYTYIDKDAKNFPVGLLGNLKTNAAGNGKLKVQLRHQPPAGGKATKDGTATPGSDDINIDFVVEVK